MKITDVIKGIALAVIAAYLFLVLSGVLRSQIWSGSFKVSYRDLFIDAPIFFLALASWFVMPVGGILGGAIPYFARKQNPKTAVCYGIAVGLVISVLGGIIASYLFAGLETFSSDPVVNHAAWWDSFRRNLIEKGSVMSLYSIAWTGGYAFIHAQRPNNQQIAQEAS